MGRQRRIDGEAGAYQLGWAPRREKTPLGFQPELPQLGARVQQDPQHSVGLGCPTAVLSGCPAPGVLGEGVLGDEIWGEKKHQTFMQLTAGFTQLFSITRWFLGCPRREGNAAGQCVPSLAAVQAAAGSELGGKWDNGAVQAAGNKELRCHGEFQCHVATLHASGAEQAATPGDRWVLGS